MISNGVRSKNSIVRWRSIALNDQQLTSTQKLVACAFAEVANHKTLMAHPGTKVLQDFTGLSDRAVQGAMRELAGLGYLKCVSLGGQRGGHREATVWKIKHPAFTVEGASIIVVHTGEADSTVAVHTVEGGSQTPEPRSQTPERRSDQPVARPDAEPDSGPCSPCNSSGWVPAEELGTNDVIPCPRCRPKAYDAWVQGAA